MSQLAVPDCVPNEAEDDRPAAQAAIDAATAESEATGLPTTVCFRGRYSFTRAPIGSYNRFAALSTHGKNLTIRCDDAVLELAGDQGNSTTLLLSIDPSAENIRVTGCTWDSRLATNTAEQTHAIATSGVCGDGTCKPIRHLEIDHNRFLWPRAAVGSRKGDCVRLLGNEAPSGEAPGTEVYGVRVHDNDGDCSGRSFVEIQRGVHHLTISHNTTTCGDQCVDGEATGVIGTAGRPTNTVIANNTFTDGPDAQADFSIALTSMTGVVIVGNTMPRGIASYRSDGVSIGVNWINALSMTSGRGVIDVANACDGLTIDGTVVRRGGAPGPVIAIAPHSGVTCSGVSISGATLTQGTAGHAISLESVSRAQVTGNRISYVTAAPGYSAIYSRAVMVGEPTVAVNVAGNLVTGGPTYGVTLQGHPGSFGAGVSVAGNNAPDVMFGLRCEDGGFAAPITAYGNAWLPGVWPESVSVVAGGP